jgi:uncharacterized protein
MAKFGKNEEKCVIDMWSGTRIDLLNPDPALILIDDVAAHLAKINRFVGATHREYTVAEHCLLGLEFCTRGARLEYLMHDSPEAYLGDVSGPLKRLFGMRFYRDLEESWRLAIAERFGLKQKTPAEVHEIDQRMLVTEQRDLRGRRPLSTDSHKPFRTHLPAVAPAQDQLREEFLMAFSFYAGQTGGAKR